MSKDPRFDGLGIFMLGLAALLVISVSLAGFIRTPAAPDDTSVQQSMAWATWAMTLVSVAGGAIGALSLYLIYRTLLAAQRSATAAEKTLETAMSQGKTQLRAYLTVSHAYVAPHEDAMEMAIVVIVENSGQTPTAKAHFNAEYTLTNLTSDAPSEEYRVQQILPSVGSHGTLKSKKTFFADRGTFIAGQLDDHHLSVRIELVWTDIFGDTWRDSVIFARRLTDDDSNLASIELDAQYDYGSWDDSF